MKKRFLGIVLLAPLFLVGCSPDAGQTSSDAFETNKVRRFEIDLNTENYWKYIVLSIEATGGPINPTVEIVCQGVLNYAFYQEVSMVFNWSATGDGSYGNNGFYTATITAFLNAGGNYSAVFDRDYIPENITPRFIGNNLYSHYVEMSLKSITGRVLFAI